MKKKVPYIAALLLVAVLSGLLFANYRQRQSQMLRIRQFQKEASVYEQEIDGIRLELQQRKQELRNTEDSSCILFGFLPASAHDFDAIDDLASAHTITPVILLDCSFPKAVLTDFSKKAIAKNYDIALAGLKFDESILQTADEMKDVLAQLDYKKNPVFLLRNNVDTKKNRNLLKEHGYQNLILYQDSLQAGTLENGIPYLCYGFFRTPAYYPSYISQIVTAHTMILATFNFSELQSGTLQIADIRNFLTSTDTKVAANELRYVDLSTAFQMLADQSTTEQGRKDAYETYKAEQEARILELEKKISELYRYSDQS